MAEVVDLLACDKHKLNLLFSEWNKQVYQAVDLVLENQHRLFVRELDAKSQRCAELETIVETLKGPVEEKLQRVKAELMERDELHNNLDVRVAAVESEMLVLKEIYKKALENCEGLKERILVFEGDQRTTIDALEERVKVIETQLVEKTLLQEEGDEEMLLMTKLDMLKRCES